jgi:NAD+ diphosphatase
MTVTFDRAAHRRTDLDFLERQLGARDSLLLPVWRDLTLVREVELTTIALGEAEALLDLADELVWLGELSGRSCFAIDVSRLDDPTTHPALSGRGEPRDLRLIGASLNPSDAGVAAYARGILYWHRRHRHCGVCGSPTAPREGGHMRECKSEGCATKHFPRTDPAVIMLVHDGDRCLLGRQRRWPRGMYSALAGFVEPGESLEQAVAREVREEAGVEIDDVRYFRSQPWPFPSSLMLGFTARATSIDIDVGDDELEDAGWFHRDALRDLPDGRFVPNSYSLAGQLIEAFADGELG